MRIGFIFPSSDYLYDPFRGDPHTHLQILTVLDDYFGNEIELSLFDLRGIKKRFALYHIKECDVFLYSVYTLDYEEQEAIVKGLRKRYPMAKHIAGGPHTSVYKDECFKTFDSLIYGDGEESIIRAIKDLKANKLKKEYHQITPIDINKYPYPLRKFLPESTVAREGLMTLRNKPGYDKLLSTTVIFSRGCPYNCYFCAMPKAKPLGPRLRYRKPELVKIEIEYLQNEYGIEGISLLDEISIPLERNHAIEHLKAIGETGITWRAQCRVDGITQETARLAKKAGCSTMCLGVESVSQKSLDLINKGIKAKQAKQVIKWLKENDIETRVYLIMGLPGEPKNVVDLTWNFIEETNPDLVYLSIFTIRPGTEVFNDPKKFGIKNIKTDWSKTMHMYGRYEDEIPSPTFEYEKNTPWGISFSNEEIVKNYLELQERVNENSYGPI